MSRVKFIDKDFSNNSVVMLGLVNQIVEEYSEQGYRLTLRQLYYQFVSRGWLENKVTEYGRLGNIVNQGRLAGEIDWDAIEDRGRNLIRISHWERPNDILESAAQSYKIDLWRNQSFRVEVWIEKEALIGVISDVCQRYRIPHFACKGYVSQSEMFEAGFNRFHQYLAEGKQIRVLHLGDHDPSGIDMTRDIQERLSMFAYEDIEVERLALNMDQIEQYHPPPNPAKSTDTRFEDYRRNFGTQSWELDALDPRTLTELIQTAILQYLEVSKWDKEKKIEREQRKQIQTLADNFDHVMELMKDE